MRIHYGVLMILIIAICTYSTSIEPFIVSRHIKLIPHEKLKYTKRYVSRYWLQILHDYSDRKLLDKYPDKAIRADVKWIPVTEPVKHKLSQLNSLIGHDLLMCKRMANISYGLLVEVTKRAGYELANFYHKGMFPEPSRKYWLLMDKSAKRYRIYGLNVEHNRDNKSNHKKIIQNEGLNQIKSVKLNKHPSLQLPYRCIGVPKHLRTDYPLECLIHGGYWDRPCKDNHTCPYWDSKNKTGGCLTKIGGFCELPEGVYPESYHWIDFKDNKISGKK